MMTAMETVVSQKMNKKVMQRNVVDDHATAISKCDALLGKVVCMVDDVNDFDNASSFLGARV